MSEDQAEGIKNPKAALLARISAARDPATDSDIVAGAMAPQAECPADVFGAQATSAPPDCSIAEAREAGWKVGIAKGALDERKRIAGILDHENAKGREATARKLAFATEMTIEEAGAFMSDLPLNEAPKLSRLDAAMAREQRPFVSPAGPGLQAQRPVVDTTDIYARRAAAMGQTR